MKENIANGVFVDRFRTPCTADTLGSGLLDARDLSDDCNDCGADPLLKVTFAAIQAQGDGSTHTLMFAEGLNALQWMLYGGDVQDKKWHFGFCWEQPELIQEALTNSTSQPEPMTSAQFRIVNGVREMFWKDHVGDKGPNSAFPSSLHPSGVNVAFVGGQVVFLSEKIDPVVFAQLMTSNSKQSDLVVNGRADRDLPKPGADDY
jgi:prepilin-type processing-associated H-X9-DG protein